MFLSLFAKCHSSSSHSWVTPLSKLRKLERLPTHEDALKVDMLDELTALSTQPSCAYSFFISQVRRSTLVLERLREHLG